MPRENLNDLQAFVHVAREGSFTKAAAQLGVSQSALSHAMRGLEQRLGVRLLTRTTRSVSTTEAGARLLDTLGPRLAEIEDGLAALAEYRERPAGTIRINATGHAAEYIAWKKTSARPTCSWHRRSCNASHRRWTKCRSSASATTRSVPPRPRADHQLGADRWWWVRTVGPHALPLTPAARAAHQAPCASPR